MIGSHNSISYLPPKNFWGKITRLWNKCQDKTLEEQYNKLNENVLNFIKKVDSDISEEQRQNGEKVCKEISRGNHYFEQNTKEIT